MLFLEMMRPSKSDIFYLHITFLSVYCFFFISFHMHFYTFVHS